MKMSDTVKILENLFDSLNAIYFDSKLPKPVITVQSTPKAYGHCSVKKIWKSETESTYEINIGAEYINRPIEQTAATLCHEMVHLYCRENDITETCQNGRYHNKVFKAEAESRDLKIDYDRAIGYSITAPTETFINKLHENGFDMTIKFARVMMAKPSANRVKAHKYICPCCGQEVRSTSELFLICGLCKVDMIKEG